MLPQETLPTQHQRTSYTLREIEVQVSGQLTGDPNTVIVGVNALELTGPGELTFAESHKLAAQVRQSLASAAFVLLTGTASSQAENPPRVQALAR